MRCVLLLLALAAAPAATQERSVRTNYILHCAGCHGTEGMGSEAGGIPAFSGSIGAIAGTDLGRTYMLHVPGITASGLGDAETAAVLNYVLEAWSDGAAPAFDAAEVARRRAVMVHDIVALRRSVKRKLDGQGIAIADYPWP